MRRAVECLSRRARPLLRRLPEDPRLREELDLPAFEDALVDVDPGYPRPLRICRLDAFLSGYDVKFLEFNADSPAGIGYTDVLYEGLAEAIQLPRVEAEFETAYTPMLPVLLDTLLDAYAALRRSPTGACPSAAARAGRPARQPVGARVPDHLRAPPARRGSTPLHATTDELDYDGSALRIGRRAGASRLPPRADRGARATAT